MLLSPDVSPVAWFVPIVSPPVLQYPVSSRMASSRFCLPVRVRLPSASVPRMGFEYMIPVSTVTAKRTYTFWEDPSRRASMAELHVMLTSECSS